MCVRQRVQRFDCSQNSTKSTKDEVCRNVVSLFFRDATVEFAGDRVVGNEWRLDVRVRVDIKKITTIVYKKDMYPNEATNSCEQKTVFFPHSRVYICVCMCVCAVCFVF